jgi:hypothetical protein
MPDPTIAARSVLAAELAEFLTRARPDDRLEITSQGRKEVGRRSQVTVGRETLVITEGEDARLIPLHALSYVRISPRSF